MELIIETVEKAIKDTEFSINYHKEGLAKETEKLRKLKNELNELNQLTEKK